MAFRVPEGNRDPKERLLGSCPAWLGGYELRWCDCCPGEGNSLQCSSIKSKASLTKRDNKGMMHRELA